MSIDGIGGLVPGIIPTPREAAQETEPSAEPQFELGQRTSDPGDAAIARRTDHDAALPERAPTGADPEAWSLLTEDERAFFQDPALLGPVTYGRGSIDAAMTALGSMLDVRG